MIYKYFIKNKYKIIINFHFVYKMKNTLNVFIGYCIIYSSHFRFFICWTCCSVNFIRRRILLPITEVERDESTIPIISFIFSKCFSKRRHLLERCYLKSKCRFMKTVSVHYARFIMKMMLVMLTRINTSITVL